MLRRLSSAAEKYGLKVNYGAGKTEVVVLGAPSPRAILRPDGVPLREVPDYKYLGSLLTSSRADFLRNKSLAWQVIHRLKSVWRSTLQLDLKALLFKSYVVPIFLSGAETWFVGKELLADVSGAYTCMVRHVRNIKVYSRDTRLSNTDLFGEQFPRIEVLLQKKRLRFAGHCARSAQPISRVMLAETTRGKRPGRPLMSMRSVLQADLGMKDTTEILEEMLDRSSWSAAVRRAEERTLRGTTDPPRKQRKGVKPRGVGSGRPRKATVTAAARRMRRINALKVVDELVCAARNCNAKACREHCTACRHAFAIDDHGGCPLLTCKYCQRVTAASCARIGRTHARALRHSFVCKDCSHLLDDLR